MPCMGRSAQIVTPAVGISLLLELHAPYEVVKKGAGEQACMRDPGLLQIVL